MKTLKYVFLLVFISNFLSCDTAKTPFVEHGWACQGDRTQPYKVWRQQYLGEWRLGWQENSEDPINFGPYTWNDLKEVPGLRQQFEVAGEKWFIIDMITEKAGNNVATTKTCIFGCPEYCELAGGVFNGAIVQPGTSLSHCVCIFD